MKTPHNIEARKFPGHDYRVGYDAHGYAWRIRGTTGGYIARPSRTDRYGCICADTLADMGSLLSCTFATESSK